jgi:hypothetical protein
MPSTRTVSNVVDKAGLNLGGKFSTALAFGFGAFEYTQRRKEGESGVSALIKTAASTAFYNMVPWVAGAQLTYGLGQMVTTALPMAASTLSGLSQSGGTNFLSTYNDTQAAYTMRQRGVQAIQRSVMNNYSMLGQEARLMHRG